MISTKQNKEAEMSNGNEVTISINVSDDLLDKVMSAMEEKVPAIEAYADIHLIVGFFFSVLLPIVGIAGSCLIVRYTKDYSKCLLD